MTTSVDPRKRTLYISSENVDYFTSSDRVSINLNQTVLPEDGHILTYALKSLGFNSTAMNISEHQKNNKLRIALEYDDTAVTHVATKTTPDGNITSIVTKANSNVRPLKLEFVTITVPDGSYTLRGLFGYLSTYTNRSFIIPSGYYLDYEGDIEDVDNIIPIRLNWSELQSGFTIQLMTDYLEAGSVTATYTDHVNATTYTPTQLFSKLKSVSIVPHDYHPKLFDILFTNLNTQYEDTPISIPPGTLHRGLNPHKGVNFNFTIADMTRPDLMTKIKITEFGNEHIYDATNRLYPIPERINYHFYQAYYKPNLDPTYVDVVISLPNSAMDERGHRNILTRLFTLGSKDGGSSFFQMWEAPKVTVLNGISGFSSITIDIESQENKWNFFNLEFSIELEISEIKEEDPEDTHQKVDLDIPVSDPVADAAKQNGPRHHKALASHHFSYRKGGLHVQKKSRHV